MLLGTSQAAAKIGTTSKLLRKFLRNNPDYQGVGIGARYAFEEKDLETLSEDFKSWRGSSELRPRRKTGERIPPELAYLNEDPGVDVNIMAAAPRNAYARKVLREKRHARNEKLLARMKEVGVA